MRRLRWVRLLGMVGLLLAVFCASKASAAKITVVNQTDLKVSVALKWWADGADSAGGTKGWYGVEPGATRTIVWKGIDGAAVQVGSMGYYAKAKGLVWKGKGKTGVAGWIHPTRAFETTEPDEAIEGGQEVEFRVFDVNLDAGRSGAEGKIVLKR